MKLVLPLYLFFLSDSKFIELYYLRIEDIAEDFVYPCVMDLKMGEITWEPGVTEDKIAGQKVSHVSFCKRIMLDVTS